MIWPQRTYLLAFTEAEGVCGFWDNLSLLGFKDPFPWTSSALACILVKYIIITYYYNCLMETHYILARFNNIRITVYIHHMLLMNIQYKNNSNIWSLTKFSTLYLQKFLTSTLRTYENERKAIVYVCKTANQRYDKLLSAVPHISHDPTVDLPSEVPLVPSLLSDFEYSSSNSSSSPSLNTDLRQNDLKRHQHTDLNASGGVDNK